MERASKNVKNKENKSRPNDTAAQAKSSWEVSVIWSLSSQVSGLLAANAALRCCVGHVQAPSLGIVLHYGAQAISSIPL